MDISNGKRTRLVIKLRIAEHVNEKTKKKSFQGKQHRSRLGRSQMSRRDRWIEELKKCPCKRKKCPIDQQTWVTIKDTSI